MSKTCKDMSPYAVSLVSSHCFLSHRWIQRARKPLLWKEVSFFHLSVTATQALKHIHESKSKSENSSKCKRKSFIKIRLLPKCIFATVLSIFKKNSITRSILVVVCTLVWLTVWLGPSASMSDDSALSLFLADESFKQKFMEFDPDFLIVSFPPSSWWKPCRDPDLTWQTLLTTRLRWKGYS